MNTEILDLLYSLDDVVVELIRLLRNNQTLNEWEFGELVRIYRLRGKE